MDLILYNARVRTMDNQIRLASAIAIKNGIIIQVGSNEEILSLKTPETKTIDVGGKLIVPGFNDSHLHSLMTAQSANSVFLFGAKSVEEVLERTKKFIKDMNVPEGEWVTGWGWNQDEFDVPVFPTRQELDKISENHPIALSRACGHISACNTKAVEIAGCITNVPKLVGGQIDVDKNGDPTGIFREGAALELLSNHFATVSKEKIKEYILQISKAESAQGITSIQTDDFSTFKVPYETVINAYKELAEEGKMTVRVYQQCLLRDTKTLNDFISKGYANAEFTPFYRLGPLKILSDGSLGARTAYLAEDYHDEPGTRGIPVMSQEDLDELVLTAHKADMQVAIHAIGDGAMDMVLTAFEKAQREYPRVDPRHGIIHCQITDMPILERYRKQNILAFVQPVFLDYDMHIVEPRVGKEKASTSYAFNTLTEMGVHTSFGTDCPVERFDTLANIYHAVTRKDKKGFPEGGYNPDEKMSVYDAVRSYTIESAYCSREENVKGTLSTGKYADLVVLSEDIFEIESEEIINAKVLMTIVDGKIVYEA